MEGTLINRTDLSLARVTNNTSRVKPRIKGKFVRRRNFTLIGSLRRNISRLNFRKNATFIKGRQKDRRPIHYTRNKYGNHTNAQNTTANISQLQIIPPTTEVQGYNLNTTTKWKFKRPGIVLSDYQLIITIAFFLGLVFVGSSLLTAILCLIKKRKCPFLSRHNKKKFRTPRHKPSSGSVAYIEKPTIDGNLSVDFGISDRTPLVPPSESEKYDTLPPLPTETISRLQSKCDSVNPRRSHSQSLRNSIHGCQVDNGESSRSNSSFTMPAKAASTKLLFPPLSSSKQSLGSIDKSLLSLEHTSRIASPDFEQVKMQFKQFTDHALSQNSNSTRPSSSLTNIYEREYRERDGKKMEPSVPTPCILPNSEESESEKSVY